MYSENLKIGKIVIRLDSFSEQIYNKWVFFVLTSVFETTVVLNFPIYSIYLWLLLQDLVGSLVRLSIVFEYFHVASFSRPNRVTDEAFYYC